MGVGEVVYVDVVVKVGVVWCGIVGVENFECGCFVLGGGDGDGD